MHSTPFTENSPVRSQFQSALRFGTRVFDEVLPSIRKHGAYVYSDGMESDDVFKARDEPVYSASPSLYPNTDTLRRRAEVTQITVHQNLHSNGSVYQTTRPMTVTVSVPGSP